MTSVTVDSSGGVTTVSLHGPAKGNALDIEASSGLRDLLRQLEGGTDILVLRGGDEGTFVAGADVAEIRARTVQDNLRLLNAQVFTAIEEYGAPTVAVVDGPALGGGCELALSCDIRLTTPRAVWGLPEVQLGLVPAAGGMYRLARLVGEGVAMEMILTGRRLGGEEAHRIGLSQRLCEPDALDTSLAELIAELQRPSRFAQQLAKKVVQSRRGGGGNQAIDALAQALCVLDAETQDRLAAFLNRSSKGRT